MRRELNALDLYATVDTAEDDADSDLMLMDVVDPWDMPKAQVEASEAESAAHTVDFHPQNAWLLLATWAAISLVIAVSGLSDYLILVPTLVAAILAATVRTGKVWWMYAAVVVVLVVAILGAGALFSVAGDYPATVLD